MWTFHYFNFKSNYDVLKSKSQCISLIKSINLNKNETELKMENPTNTFRENLELANKKIGHFLYRLFCPKEIFFNICVLSQCVVYWIKFLKCDICIYQNVIYQKHITYHISETFYIYFTYQKTLLHTLFCLFLKLLKAFSVSLRSLFSVALFSSRIHSGRGKKLTSTYMHINRHFKDVVCLSCCQGHLKHF